MPRTKRKRQSSHLTPLRTQTAARRRGGPIRPIARPTRSFSCRAGRPSPRHRPTRRMVPAYGRSIWRIGRSPVPEIVSMRIVQSLDMVRNRRHDFQFTVKHGAGVNSQPLLVRDIFRHAVLGGKSWQHHEPDEPDGQDRGGQTAPTLQCCSRNFQQIVLEMSPRLPRPSDEWRYRFKTAEACGKTFSNMIQAIKRLSARFSDWPHT